MCGDEDGKEGFAMKEACEHHVPGYWKALEMKREREEKENGEDDEEEGDASENEHKTSIAIEEDDGEESAEMGYASDEYGGQI